MRCRGALVVLLVLISIHASVHCDESSDFVQTKENEVRTIALAAQDNYANSCELVSACLSPQSCSRLACYPPPKQSSETTCVSVNDNKWCSNKTGAACNSVEANFLRGYVRTPPLNFSSAQEREIYLGSSICTQRNLDPTFVSVKETLRSNSSVGYFYNLYFGSIDGSFRYYPGREVLNNGCNTYDPRIRPWFIGAISILKDVVVVIDTGTAMQENANFLDPTSYLETTLSMINSFVRTLAAGDRISVIPVNASGSYQGQPYQYNVPANGPLNLTATDFQNLVSYISGLAFSGVGANGNQTPTNFTDGFVRANSTFSNASPSNAMKIVIFITNSQRNNIPQNGDLSAADELKQLGAQLFLYDLSLGVSSWDTYACQDAESQQLLSVNPLLFLSSYFSFLATARIAASGGQATPFWQNPYVGASGLGLVMSVAYPAMAPNGQLIGVAGIDVQLAGLDSDPLLKSGVQKLLTSSAYQFISQNENAGKISICQTAYTTNCSGITLGSTTSVCMPSTEPASDEVLTALLCCESCTADTKSTTNVVVGVSVGALSGLLALFLLAVTYLLIRLKRRRAAREQNSFAMNEYSIETLEKATNGFAPKNIIGKGTFGTVYKAVIGDETVAVKELSQPADRAEDFEAEIKILGRTNHPNLVELKGTCFQPSRCYLVYELVDSGDLQSWLWPEEKGGSDSQCLSKRFLNWNKRKKIARGVARGLNYLHRGLPSKGSVFHLDIKPSNILLEHNFNPKIADFGISQLYEPGYTFRVAPVVGGTFGYIAPEVLQGQVKPNSKLDVYSYGMVLLQLMSGRRTGDPDVKPFLLQWARTKVHDGYVERVVDANLIRAVQEEYREVVMQNCIQLINLALRCLSDRPESRPEMSEVFEIVDSFRDINDLETLPSCSEDDRSSSADQDKSTDVKLTKARSSISSRSTPFSGERPGSFTRLDSDLINEAESMEGNAANALSVSLPVTKWRDSLQSSIKGDQDGPGARGRSYRGNQVGSSALSKSSSTGLGRFGAKAENSTAPHTMPDTW